MRLTLPTSTHFIYISYYRGSAGALIVYDITDRDSFDKLKSKWIPEVRDSTSDDVVLALIGNKSDLEHKRAVSIEEGTSFAGTIALHRYRLECSPIFC